MAKEPDTFKEHIDRMGVTTAIDDTYPGKGADGDGEAKAGGDGGFGPWFTILFKPRKTIRKIMADDPGADVFLLALLEGYSGSLVQLSHKTAGDERSMGAILFLWAPLSALIYMVFKIYGVGSLIYWPGRWLGGEDRVDRIRAAVAWSGMPNVLALLLWVPAFCFLQEELFTSEVPRIESSLFLASVDVVFRVALAVAAVWSAVLLVATVAEAQRFSILKALANLALGFLLFIGALFGLTFVLSLVCS